jgi:hypothetical protein
MVQEVLSVLAVVLNQEEELVGTVAAVAVVVGTCSHLLHQVELVVARHILLKVYALTSYILKDTRLVMDI